MVRSFDAVKPLIEIETATDSEIYRPKLLPINMELQ
jgi:hypothetical protein